MRILPADPNEVSNESEEDEQQNGQYPHRDDHEHFHSTVSTGIRARRKSISYGQGRTSTKQIDFSLPLKH